MKLEIHYCKRMSFALQRRNFVRARIAPLLAFSHIVEARCSFMHSEVDFQIDWDREARTGVPEAVFCRHKSAAQIDDILAAARAAHRRMLLTHLGPTIYSELKVRADLDFDTQSCTAIFGGPVPQSDTGVTIVAAGTSDVAVAREALRTLYFAGHGAPLIADVGVAGLWRLTARLNQLRTRRVIIAVAGMEGALFGVLAGLVAAPVIAVPTSVGYGISAGGMTALHSALASCAPGVLTVNIDNGFGAAAAAIKILLATRRSTLVD